MTKEPQRGGLPAASEPLVAVHREEGEGQGQGEPPAVALAEPGQRRPDAGGVEPSVAAEGRDDGADGRGGRMVGVEVVAVAEALPKCVMAAERAPSPADAGGGGKRAGVESGEHLHQHVWVVVDMEAALEPLLLPLLSLPLPLLLIVAAITTTTTTCFQLLVVH